MNLISFDEFKTKVGKTLNERYNNYQWIWKLERKHIYGGILYFHNPRILYDAAKCSYMNGCYLSVIPLIYNAIEQYLLWKNQFLKYATDSQNDEYTPTTPYLKLKRTPKTSQILKDALMNNIIDKKLKSEIESYKKIRNDAMHAKSPGHYNILGGTYERKSDSWEIPKEQKGTIGIIPSAEKGLELFLKILHFNIEQRNKGEFSI